MLISGLTYLSLCSYGKKNLMQALNVELITLINITYLKEK